MSSDNGTRGCVLWTEAGCVDEGGESVGQRQPVQAGMRAPGWGSLCRPGWGSPRQWRWLLYPCMLVLPLGFSQQCWGVLAVPHMGTSWPPREGGNLLALHLGWGISSLSLGWKGQGCTLPGHGGSAWALLSWGALCSERRGWRKTRSCVCLTERGERPRTGPGQGSPQRGLPRWTRVHAGSSLATPEPAVSGLLTPVAALAPTALPGNPCCAPINSQGACPQMI